MSRKMRNGWGGSARPGAKSARVSERAADGNSSASDQVAETGRAVFRGHPELPCPCDGNVALARLLSFQKLTVVVDPPVGVANEQPKTRNGVKTRPHREKNNT